MKRFMFLCLRVLLCAVFGALADGSGYFMYADFWCALYPGDHRVEYLVDWYFNEGFTMQYNSTTGNWTGFTSAGSVTASLLNADPHDVLQRKLEKQLVCVNNVDVVLNVTTENVAEPTVALQAAETSSSGHDPPLVCSAYDFYPKRIRITWYRDGQEVTSGVTATGVMTNGDWTYQVHSYLESTSGRHGAVSCVVEHASLREPRVLVWDSPSAKSQRSSVIAGAAALVFGATFLAFGLFKYRNKRNAARLSDAL